ncbi:probable negative elongation factor A at N-terminal half [Coccomyxa sp. Obi]|nr:probable negative elongation factor A at N-terminal half [Coccomyxa sp. Obi]
MSRDVAIQASAKLSGDWSAPEYAKTLSKEVLQELLPRYPKLDPLVRMRLLLSIMSLPAEVKSSMQQELEALSAAVKVDKEEWVGVIGRAVGSFDGQLDLAAVMKGSSAVRETLRDLKLRADKGKTAGVRPLEEAYLSRRLQAAARGGTADDTGHSHFKLREGVVAASAALAQPAANAEAAAKLASAAAANAVAGPAPSTPPPDTAATAHRHPSDMAAHSLGARSGGMGDMFRSARPVHVGTNRPVLGGAASAGGLERGDRKGMQRTAKAKLIDVNEVRALQQQSHPQASSASQASDHGERGAHAPGSGGARSSHEQEAELEEGEVAEEGELPMPAAQLAKRFRLHGPPKAHQPYREQWPHNGPPPFSPPRYQDAHLSPSHSRQTEEHAPKHSAYATYNGGSAPTWQDFDAPGMDHARNSHTHHKRHSMD